MKPALDGLRALDATFSRKRWWMVFLGLAGLKLLLAAKSEIRTGLFDEVGYALNSLHWFRHDPPTMESFQRAPGFPFLALFSREIGLPYRLFLELLAAGVIGFLARSWCRLAGSPLSGLVLAGLLLFHPWLWQSCDEFMSEPPFLVASLCWLGCTARLLLAASTRRRMQWSLASGLCLFFMAMIRLELLVLVLFALMAGGAILVTWRPSGAMAWRHAGGIAILPLVVMLAGEKLVCLANGYKCGVASVCGLEAPGLTHLLQQLNTIQAPNPQRYAPITQKTLDLAMAVSPHLREIKQSLAIQGQGSPNYASGERGWMLLWDILQSSPVELKAQGESATNPRTLNAYWQTCADEIAAALKQGKLPRAAYAPYPLNPNYGEWLGAYPASWWREIRWLCRLKTSERRRNVGEKLLQTPWTPLAIRLLDEAAGRRIALLPSTFIDGYAYSRQGPVDEVRLQAADGAPLATATPTPARLPAELAELLPTPVTGHERCRFRFDLRYGVPAGSLLTLVKDGRTLSIQPFTELFYPGGGDGSAGMFELQTLKIRTDNAERGWREKVGHFLSHSFRWVELVGCLFCLMLGALSRTTSVASNVRSRLFLLIIAGCLFARCSFYAMADACAWTDGSRYPRALSLWVTIFLLGVFFLGRTTGGKSPRTPIRLVMDGGSGSLRVGWS